MYSATHRAVVAVANVAIQPRKQIICLNIGAWLTDRGVYEQQDDQHHMYKQAVREAATICPLPLQVDLWPFDLESLKVVSESRGTLCQF